ncbi:MAG TPA: hypothetical protein VHS31_18250, partial [Tepidisphaeraceae bacterium]|nr:hypothetical protein [Tepidisphaeraceae bacterium]
SAQSGTDPDQAIQNAIESVFKNGSDPTSSDSTSDSTDPTASTDPAAANSIDPQAAREQFFQTLQAHGVDPQQFHQDFLGAMQDAQNGNADPSSVFKNFPPGTVLDQTA